MYVYLLNLTYNYVIWVMTRIDECVVKNLCDFVCLGCYWEFLDLWGVLKVRFLWYFRNKLLI